MSMDFDRIGGALRNTAMKPLRPGGHGRGKKIMRRPSETAARWKGRPRGTGRPSPPFPSPHRPMRRPMMSFMISVVPPAMLTGLRSAYRRATSYSAMKPYPP